MTLCILPVVPFRPMAVVFQCPPCRQETCRTMWLLLIWPRRARYGIPKRPRRQSKQISPQLKSPKKFKTYRNHVRCNKGCFCMFLLQKNSILLTGSSSPIFWWILYHMPSHNKKCPVGLVLPPPNLCKTKLVLCQTMPFLRQNTCIRSTICPRFSWV